MQEAEKPQVVLVLHSIGWHLHDCIITFISPAGENGKELCNRVIFLHQKIIPEDQRKYHSWVGPPGPL